MFTKSSQIPLQVTEVKQENPHLFRVVFVLSAKLPVLNSKKLVVTLVTLVSMYFLYFLQKMQIFATHFFMFVYENEKKEDKKKRTTRRRESSQKQTWQEKM